MAEAPPCMAAASTFIHPVLFVGHASIVVHLMTAAAEGQGFFMFDSVSSVQALC